MRSILAMMMVGVLLLTGCATTLLKRDIRAASDGWTLVFHQLSDGPNGFTTRGATQMLPRSGQHFLWVVLTVRNDSPGPRAFNFESCALEMGSSGSLPLYVGLNFGTSAEMAMNPEFAAGEEITRKLAFGYPDGRVPKHMDCFGNLVSFQ